MSGSPHPTRPPGAEYFCLRLPAFFSLSPFLFYITGDSPDPPFFCCFLPGFSHQPSGFKLHVVVQTGGSARGHRYILCPLPFFVLQPSLVILLVSPGAPLPHPLPPHPSFSLPTRCAPARLGPVALPSPHPHQSHHPRPPGGPPQRSWLLFPFPPPQLTELLFYVIVFSLAWTGSPQVKSCP
jgi:hypothetical protein